MDYFCCYLNICWNTASCKSTESNFQIHLKFHTYSHNLILSYIHNLLTYTSKFKLSRSTHVVFNLHLLWGSTSFLKRRTHKWKIKKGIINKRHREEYNTKIIVYLIDTVLWADMAKSQNISHVIRLDCHHKENTNIYIMKYEKNSN